MKIEIAPGFWLGDARGFETANPDWTIISAAKEPWHREMVGYAPGARAPDGPERFVAARGRHLALNWVDVAKASWFRREELIAAEVHCIAYGNPILVHCNSGRSRGPALALWLLGHGGDFAAAYKNLHEKYPLAFINPGLLEFVKANWNA